MVERRSRAAAAGAFKYAAVAFVLAIVASACTLEGLSFVQDTSVKILEPETNAEVRLPFTVEWTAEEPGQLFAVFFDRSPMRPNQTLRSLVPDDDPCRDTPGCPDRQWLADRDVYITEDTTLEITFLPDRRVSGRQEDRHDVTIVLLDEDGRRAGEAAFTKEFIMERD